MRKQAKRGHPANEQKLDCTRRQQDSASNVELCEHMLYFLPSTVDRTFYCFFCLIALAGTYTAMLNGIFVLFLILKESFQFFTTD